MDVDNITKVNKLARDLVEHGVADNMDSAITEAEKILSKKQQVGEIKKSVEEEEVKRSAEELLKEEIRKLNSVMSNQGEIVEKLQEKVSALTREIDDLKSRQQTPVVEKEPQQEQATLKTEEKKPHPKIGEYDSEDVSVENMFYSGPPRD